MQERFSPKHLALYSGFNVLPPIMMVNASWREDFKTIIKESSDDFVDICGLDAELHLWYTYWLPKVKYNKLNDELLCIAKVLKMTDMTMFPGIYNCLKLLATVHVSSSQRERTISVLRRLKPYLRNTMCQDRFSALALLNIHREFKDDIENIINKFANLHPRKIDLCNILQSDLENVETHID